MARTIFCEGRFVAEDGARISIFDRGLLFGDSVYEVTAVLDGRMVDNDLHLARLERSLGALDIPMPMPAADIAAVQSELIVRNGLVEGTIYLQVSRGTAERDFLFPEGLAPGFFAFTQARRLRDTPAQRDGVAVALMPDPRWSRRDIKTTMLLGQVLAKREGKAGGFGEVWMLEDGHITEGASSSAFIVTGDGRIVTRSNSRAVLPGCTRQAVLRLCETHDYRYEERAFTPEDAFAAREAFLTSASSLVTPVVRIDDRPIGDGRPGPATRRIQRYYLEAALGTG
jgi:D-alanine transaminase